MAEEEVTEEVSEPVEEAPEPARKKRRQARKAAKAAKSRAPRKKVKRFSFSKWAARRDIPWHNRAGLAASVPNVEKPRTLEEWDECFKGY